MRWLVIIVVFLLSSLLIQPIIWSQPNEDITKKVDCYDRFSNKIEGLTCYDKTTGMPFGFKIILSLILFLVSIIIPIGMIPKPHRSEI